MNLLAQKSLSFLMACSMMFAPSHLVANEHRTTASMGEKLIAPIVGLQLLSAAAMIAVYIGLHPQSGETRTTWNRVGECALAAGMLKAPVSAIFLCCSAPWSKLCGAKAYIPVILPILTGSILAQYASIITIVNWHLINQTTQIGAGIGVASESALIAASGLLVLLRYKASDKVQQGQREIVIPRAVTEIAEGEIRVATIAVEMSMVEEAVTGIVVEEQETVSTVSAAQFATQVL